MKIRTALLLILVSSVYSECKKEGPVLYAIPAQLAGLWVPHQQRNIDGTDVEDVARGTSIFGTYYESVLFRGNRDFTPCQYVDAENVYFSSSGKGYYLPIKDGKLTMYAKSNNTKFEFKIEKFEEGELWLSNKDKLYKFKKRNG